MKRKYLGFAPLAAAAAMVMAMVIPGKSAQSEPTQLQLADSSHELTLVEAEPMVCEAMAVKKQIKASSIDDVVGTYMTRDISVFTPERESNALIEVKKNNDGTVTISNLYRLGQDVIAQWDASTSTLQIKPQVIFQHDTYGPVTINTWTLSADGKKTVYNTTAPIVVTPCEDGSLSFSPWGIFVQSGPYAGGTFEAYYSSNAYHPNGTMTSTPFDTTLEKEEYPVLLMEDTPGRVMVCNMLNNGLGIMMDVNPSGTGEITPQWVYNQALYGDFYIYAGKLSGTGTSQKFLVDKEGTIKATQTESGIEFSIWGCVCLKSTTIFAKQSVASSIKTDFKLNAPSVGENPMKGSGTSTEPYKVESMDHLQWIAKSISSTQSFKDVYFELANDIDAKNFTGRYYPIGGIDNLPFQGKFDGKGYSIKNLTQNFYGARYAGVFGYLGDNGSLKNVKVENLNYVNSGKYIGGLVGYAASAVENCSVSGEIESTGIEIGGVVGYSIALISGCDFTGNIYGGTDMGGIVGYTTNKVENCHANAAINLTTYIPNGTGTHCSGGIVGAAYGKSTAKTGITNCYFGGSISDQQRVNQLGGICGAMWYGTISKCFNVGRVTCSYGAGADGNSPLAAGICGYTGDVTIDNCYNAGAINAPNSDFSGGIMGYTGGNSSSVSGITNCYNSGMVNTYSKAKTAAIIGSVWEKVKTFSYENNYFDNQTAGLEYPCDGGLSTEELISGNPIPGFSTDIWLFEKGYYPRLKGLSDSKEANLSASALMLSDNETIKKVRKPFTVSTANNISWGFMNTNGEIVPSCEGMTVDGSNVTLAKGKYALESIIATTTDGTIKHYIIHIDPVAFEGSGTKEDPFKIQNANDLYTLQKATNEYLQPHKGDYFLMTNDIDVSAVPAFKGIAADGSSAHYFGGTFDGGNHYIHNFKLHSGTLGADGKIAETSHDYAGFIGITLPDAVVKNVRIADDCEFELYRYSAPVVGYSIGRVENCHNYAPVKAYGQACGGVVGMVATEESSVEGCLNAGNVSLANGTCAGVVGYSAGIVKGCQNIGNVKLSSITGVSMSNTTKNVAGIVGQNFGTVEGCVNGASVEGLTNVGGIVGENSIMSTTLKGGDISNCLSYGVISVESSATTTVGGIVGNLASFNTISSNYYDAQLHPFGGANMVDPEGITGLETEEVQKIKLAGMASVSGQYPAVSTLADNELVKSVSKTYVLFDQLSHRNAMETEATIKLADGATASLQTGADVKIDGSRLVLSLGDKEMANDTLVIQGNKFTRSIPLRAVAALFAGKGTQDDPHIIANIADWNKLAKATKESQRDFKGHNFKLSADLKFSETDFASVGEGVTPFNGIFDGTNHTISGFVTGSTSDKTSLTRGLFDHVGPFGKIANLKIKDANISAYQYAGAFAGELCGTIENCVSEAEVTTGSGYAGGLVGSMKLGSSAVNCKNLGTVSTLAGTYVGGIASVCYGRMTDCVNEGDVIACTQYGGGLAGTMGGPATNCENKGEVMASKASASTYLGGLFGQLETGANITDCTNYGELTGGKSYVGGIFGAGKTTAALLKENGVTVKGCKNSANLTSTSTYLGGIAGSVPASYSIIDCINTGKISNNANYLGGIVGSVGSGTFDVIISNCRNEGEIVNTTSAKQYIAGIAGYNVDNCKIIDCVNTGTIQTDGSFVGGISGSCGGAVEKCVNHGSITGKEYALGGIIGYGGSDSKLNDCVNIGNVTATGTTTKTYGTVAGIVGYGYSKVNACANFGTLSGNQNIGGIAGTGFNGIMVTNCYNAGKIIYTKEGATNIGNIYASTTSMSGNYYDSEMNGELPSDVKVGATGLTKHALMDKEIPGFTNAVASYPIPSGAINSPEARIATLHYRLADGSTSDNVLEDFKVGSHESITWSVSDESIATIDGNDVKLSKAINKPLTLTATCGNLSRSFEFIINCSTSGITDMTDMDAESEGVETLYFTPDGQPATANTQGILIVVKKNANGTMTTTKRIVK